MRPSIQTSPVKSLTVKEGEEARLYCGVVGGDPKPGLRWRRKGGKMPAGEEEILGEVVILESVTRHHAGTYECLVEEEAGFAPVSREVTLYVKCEYQQYCWICASPAYHRCPGSRDRANTHQY